MNTNSNMRGAAAAVVGARHMRTARNGQDAAAVWTGRAAAAPVGAIVVCDGCGAGASSEVGARLGAQLVIAALSVRLGAGERPDSAELWAGVRAEVCTVLARLVDAMPGAREQVVHEHFLFTIVAAAVAGREIGVWAIGDGAYAIVGSGAPPRVLGPFVDNQPPYLAYDLLDAPAPAHLETARVAAGTVVVATDGVAELGLETFVDDATVARWLRHPDALRRQLAVLARSSERADWAERRMVRTAAPLQDDGAIALLSWTTTVEPS